MNVKYVKSGHLTKFWPSGKPDGDRGQMHSKAIVVVMMVVVVVVVVVVMVVVIEERGVKRALRCAQQRSDVPLERGSHSSLRLSLHETR